MDEPNVKTLNELLRGEHMAIQSCEAFCHLLRRIRRSKSVAS